MVICGDPMMVSFWMAAASITIGFSWLTYSSDQESMRAFKSRSSSFKSLGYLALLNCCNNCASALTRAHYHLLAYIIQTRLCDEFVRPIYMAIKILLCCKSLCAESKATVTLQWQRGRYSNWGEGPGLDMLGQGGEGGGVCSLSGHSLIEANCKSLYEHGARVGGLVAF
jgi:hypothetical protein